MSFLAAPQNDLVHSHQGFPKLFGLSLVIVAASLWATVGIAVGLMPRAAPLEPITLAFLRTALGALTLLGIAALIGRLTLRNAPWPLLLLFGSAGAILQYCLFQAFMKVGVTITVAFTVCLPPLILAVVNAVAKRCPPSIPLLAGIALATIGVLLLLRPGWEHTEAREDSLHVWALLLGAPVAFSVLAVAARHAGQRFDKLCGTGLSLGICAALLAMASAATDVSIMSGIETLTSFDIGVLLYIGAIATGVAYLAFTTGLSLCRSSTCGLVATMIEPLLAAVLANMVLGERLSPAELIGCASIVGAVTLAALAELRSARGP